MEKEKIIKILELIGLPTKFLTEQTYVCIRALLEQTNTAKYQYSKSVGYRIHDIIIFAREELGIRYAENTRESIRKQSLKPLCNYGVARRHYTSINDPNTSYTLNKEFIEMLEEANSLTINRKVQTWKKKYPYASYIRKIKHNSRKLVSVSLPSGEEINLSPGRHNILIKEILETHALNFIEDPILLYIGDAEYKMKYLNEEKLADLKLYLNVHGKLPDVLVYSSEGNMIYVFESVTSAGPVNEMRKREIMNLIRSEERECKVIFTTVFPDRSTFRKFSDDIAWGTQVWIAEEPKDIIFYGSVKKST